jgi:prepilin peptidase CpaA
MFALGLLVHTAANRWPGLQFSFFGFATGFGVLVVLWLFGGGGGGDVKMMTALGAWLGAVLTIEVFLASAVFTVIIMLGGVVYAAITKRRGPRARTKNSSGRREERSRPGRVLPYAVPLSLATWAVVAYTIWLRDGHLFESLY